MDQRRQPLPPRNPHDAVVTALAAAALLAGCSSKSAEPAPAPEPAALRIDVALPDGGSEAVEIRPGATIDLWPLVDRHRAHGLAARGAGGEIAHATTAYRDDHQLRLLGRDGSVDVELRRRPGGVLVAGARDVRELRLTAPPAEPGPELSLIVEGGGRSRQFGAAALPGLATAPARRRDGVPVADILAAAGWKPSEIGAIEATGEDGRQTFPGAGTLRVKTNNRGQLVLRDADGNQLRGLTRLRVVPRDVIQRKPGGNPE